jgi:hypothetical protein
MNISVLFLNLSSRDVILTHDFILNDLLNDYEKSISYLNSDQITDQKFDVLVYSCRNPTIEVHFGYAPPFEVVLDVVKKVKPKIIIQLSDEFWQENNNIHNSLADHCKLFIKEHFHWNHSYTSNTIQKPLGYLNDFPVDLENIKPINDRKYFWSWVGYLKGDRQDMINKFMRIWYHVCASNGGLSRPEIHELYSNSKFVPIGRGNSSVDCWRIYEAIVCGAIPVIVSYEDEINWSFQYKEKLPAIYASNWDEASDICIRLSDDPEAMSAKQEELLNWWKNTIAYTKEEIKKVFYETSITVICACKNRDPALKVSLRSWLNFDQISEIIIVDWSSDNSLEYLTSWDKRIKVVSVPNQNYFNQPQPLNLATKLAESKYILKLDCDYILNPYFKFFENKEYLIDDQSFVCGQNTVDRGFDPYYKYLFGFLYVSKSNFMKINGFSERFCKWYASEDQDIMMRLENLGLKKRGMDYDHNVIHIPHSDKKRTENFEATVIEKEYEDDIRERMKHRGFDGEELQWQTEFSLAQMHVNANQGWLSQMGNDYVCTDPMTEWDIERINSQYYIAKKHE